MRTVVSLSVYLDSYKISREQLMAEINKDRDFYDKYIDWKNKDSETIISPKALERLGDVFNDKTENKHEIKEDTSKKKAGTEHKEDIVEFMEKPALPEAEDIEEVKKTEKTETPKRKRSSADVATPRKKKSKNCITKQFIAEHGFLDQQALQSTKELRILLMGSGLKAEQVALMDDEEVKNTIGKEYFFIESKDGVYIIKRSALISIAGDVCFLERNI